MFEIIELPEDISRRSTGYAGYRTFAGQVDAMTTPALSGLASIIRQFLTALNAADGHISCETRSTVTILLVEQDVHTALSVAGRGYVMETGSIVRSGAAKVLVSDPAVRQAYLGL
ncbi:MAG: hypothetical protein KGK01_01820 [Bradyrhizobium sp.]|nr:hypothetical protein [Bradyrhizobium sp.]